MGWLLCCKRISFQLLKGKINHVSGTAKKKKRILKQKRSAYYGMGRE